MTTITHRLGVASARWIDIVATTILATVERWIAPRKATLTEDADGALTLKLDDRSASSHEPPRRVHIVGGAFADGPGAQTKQLQGLRVELILQPNKFLFRTIELPGRAAEFLDGVVRAQIDRLTPWTVRDAVFGWTRPEAIGNDRIALLVAATARTLVAPYIQAIASQGAKAISVFTLSPSSGAPAQPIKILEQSASGTLEIAFIRRMLLGLIVSVGVMAAISTAAAIVVGGYFDGQRDELSKRVADLRSALRTGRDSTNGAPAAQRALERRKREIPSSVIVLEALSNILPDDTYVTEFRIDGNKLQITGLSSNAASLIRLIEQSPHFTRATFFAPTTRSPGDRGEQFHIEAAIQPTLAPGT
jgi:general secretion pathway protein L